MFFFVRALFSKYCSSVVISVVDLPTLSQRKKDILTKASHFLYYSNVNTSGIITNIAGADQKPQTIIESKIKRS